VELSYCRILLDSRTVMFVSRLMIGDEVHRGDGWKSALGKPVLASQPQWLSTLNAKSLSSSSPKFMQKGVLDRSFVRHLRPLAYSSVSDVNIISVRIMELRR